MPYVALHNHSYYSLLDSTMAVEEIVAGGGGVWHARRGAGGPRHARRGGAVLQEGPGGGDPSGHRQRGDARGRRHAGAAGRKRRGLPQPLPAAHHPHRAPGRRDARRPAPVPQRASSACAGQRVPSIARSSGGTSPWRSRRATWRSPPADAACASRWWPPPTRTTARPEDRLFYDILASMRTLTMLNQAHPEKHGAGNYHLHSPDEMKQHFAIAAAGALKTRSVSPSAASSISSWATSCFRRFRRPTGDTPRGLLRRMAREGVERRYAPAAQAAKCTRGWSAS